MKRLAVMTSGGDAPGMNAAIRAVVRCALAAGIEPYGIARGYHGMMQDEIRPLSSLDVADIIQRGGTILKSARSQSFKSEEGRGRALAGARAHGIEGLIVLGGDGSFRGAMTLEAAGFPCIGIPATIDNDIACTEHCIGFDTAVNTVVDAINKIRDTATSHERIVVVETMGRSSGYIALYAGLAGGAESILIPEAPIDFAEICARIRSTQSRDKSHSIVVVAEGAFGPPEPSLSFEQSAGFRVARTIREQTGLETRLTILGHLQRGGAPTAIDRIAASRFGEAAVQLLAAGQHGLMVGLVNGAVHASPFAAAVAGQRPIDPAFHRLAGLLASQ